ncbi:gag-polypeptide of LTR copia-type [Phytophthora infestans]|uniref:Gag-polypeptide of LTR copia-type n=1 Tax=Phytophthora infestans TaxID=4787 RepID=A0A8S9TPC7_PHYIN|nr:gag-polypeptide of LTR copia-type [Phytophthora infestans]
MRSTRARASKSEARTVSSAGEQQPVRASAGETLVQAIATAVVRALNVVRMGPQTHTSSNVQFKPRSFSPSAYKTGTRSSDGKTTKSDTMGTWQLGQGHEEYDQARANRNQEWNSCYEARERKALTEMVLSLHGDLLDRVKSDIESARPAQLWTALLRTYDGTQGISSVYLRQDRYIRRLRQGEGVMGYINDLQRWRREMERMDVSLREGEIASVHSQRVSRLRGGYDRDQRVQDAVNLLLVAERTAHLSLSAEHWSLNPRLLDFIWQASTYSA